MTYQVLARKWRPRTFSTLVGQEHVVRALTHALETGRLHHAYLFTGTRGVGKTTLARILAKSLNCEVAVSAAPCGQCSACREIDAGRFVDLIEVDAATNTRVDEMRMLLENATYAPTRGRYKVYVIDEVHMLSTSAFNAMLKTLEEPPEHIKFILATTDPQKIPVTVLSRCLQFNLKKMPVPHIVAHLARILDAEAVPYEAPALRQIAKAAEGSMRDALSLLDQAIAHGAGQVQDEGVRAMLGTIGDEHLTAILDALMAQDGAGLLAQADDMDRRAASFDAALRDLGVLLHRIALAQFAPQALEADELQQLAPYAAGMDAEYVQLAYQIVTQGAADLAYAPDERTGFCMALLRLLAFRPETAAQASAPPRAAPTPRPAALQAPPPPTLAVPVPPQAAAAIAAQTGAASGAPAGIAPAGNPPGAHGVPRESATHVPARAAPSASAAPAPALPQGQVTGGDAPGDADAQSWESILSGLKLGAMALQLAQHSELLGYADACYRLRLAAEHKHLVGSSAEEKLCSALAAHCGRLVRLQFEIGATSAPTVAQKLSAEQLRRREQAIAEMRQDEFVLALKDQLDATLHEGSVKPL
ncbi:MAG: DNA polymerase III subunit gamma/tau [Rhodocyclaceae bacterium]|nr:DNA polymerase III subunit gamma/tau [Rhodocyclaceae bacterium]